jgi:hypothetical protein
MADSFNTFRNIGDTVSFDSLYRGIENMGKAIASARAAKAKASLKKDELLAKMISDKQIEKGMTPLQAEVNYVNFENFVAKAQGKMSGDPNAALNSINLDWAQYQTQADIFRDQSNIELDIKKKSSEGYAVKSNVIQDFNESSKERNMSRFLTPQKELELARQGIYVTPTPFKTKDNKGEEVVVPWALISTDLQKQKDISEELKKYTTDNANYDITITPGVAENVSGANKKNQRVKDKINYNFKDSRKTQLAEDLSNDKEIQRYYLFNDNIWQGKVLDEFNAISTTDGTKDLPLQTRLTMAAKNVIIRDVKNYDFNTQKENMEALSLGSTTNVTVNNPKPQFMTVENAATKTWTINGTPTDVLYAGLQTQWQNQANYTPGKKLTFRVGAGEAKNVTYLDSDLKPVDNKVAEISGEWEYQEVYQINGKTYIEVTPGITAAKGTNVASAFIEIQEGDGIDQRITPYYEVNGKLIGSITKWPGWKKPMKKGSTNNASNLPVVK